VAVAVAGEVLAAAVVVVVVVVVVARLLEGCLLAECHR
jgi:hypothetical protein